jgi:uncharacterized protein YaiI (UPF0178 family)
MKIWVDADACPVAIKDILFRAAVRTGVQLTLVANLPVRKPDLENVKMLQVPLGFDVADCEIVKRVKQDDLVITSDIPLAAEVILKGCLALNPRGELYTEDTIKNRLEVRDFMDSMRGFSEQMGGPAPLSHSDRQTFANNLDKLLHKHINNQ